MKISDEANLMLMQINQSRRAKSMNEKGRKVNRENSNYKKSVERLRKHNEVQRKANRLSFKGFQKTIQKWERQGLSKKKMICSCKLNFVSACRRAQLGAKIVVDPSTGKRIFDETDEAQAFWWNKYYELTAGME